MPLTGITSFRTFGDLLKYLRKRAQLTQRELAIAVGYSEAHVSRLEKNERLPDAATVAALFVPALGIENEPELAAQLMHLATSAHGQPHREESLRVETIEVSETSESIPSNLPFQLTSFIGRQSEIAQITDLFSRENPVRLVTLAGPGGIGKTRLALQTAIGLSHQYSAGIWFADLTPLSTPELVPQTVAGILNVPQAHRQSAEEALIEHLRSRQALIVFDNCEHLTQAAARLAEKILRSCAHVQILATSRESLNIPGERIFRVPPLPAPEVQVNTAQGAISHESVQLFVERARNVEPSFGVSDSNAQTIARICKRLDGMPLAIELAAARTSLLSVSQIEVRLNDRFRLLTGGQTTIPRHQTLRATLEWSHDLLSEAEQTLFRRLSVFAGGWMLEAANAVCSENEDILDLLAQLVNKSLVTIEIQPDSERRYSMLETIREYAREKLGHSGEMELVRTRHFDYYFKMAEQGEERLFAPQSSLDQAEAEIDNLRAALAWSLETRDGESVSDKRAAHGLELMLHVWLLWWSRGYGTEGTEWLHRFLSAHTTATPVRARGLLVAADLAGFRGDYAAKFAFVQESLAIARKLGDRKRIADAVMQMGLIERDLRHTPEAVEFLMEALARYEELKDNLWLCRISFLLAETHLMNGNLPETRSFLGRGMQLCRADNDRWQMAWGLEILGNVDRLENRLDQTAKYYTESLNLRVEVMDKTGIVYALEAFAQLAAARKEFRRAAVLWGAVEGLRKALNLLVDPLREDLRAYPIAATREYLGEQIFAKALAEGQKMSMGQAIEYALASVKDFKPKSSQT